MPANVAVDSLTIQGRQCRPHKSELAVFASSSHKGINLSTGAITEGRQLFAVVPAFQVYGTQPSSMQKEEV